jgi:hypothetical protein
MSQTEDTLRKVIEYAQEELSILRKRDEQRTPRGDHAHDYAQMVAAADQLDHHAHELRALHDGEFGDAWRRESRED